MFGFAVPGFEFSIILFSRAEHYCVCLFFCGNAQITLLKDYNVQMNHKKHHQPAKNCYKTFVNLVCEKNYHLKQGVINIQLHLSLRVLRIEK